MSTHIAFSVEILVKEGVMSQCGLYWGLGFPSSHCVVVLSLSLVCFCISVSVLVVWVGLFFTLMVRTRSG